jgi:hypothetical protein
MDTEHIQQWPFSSLARVAWFTRWPKIAQHVSATSRDRLHMINLGPFFATAPAPIAPVRNLLGPLFNGDRNYRIFKSLSTPVTPIGLSNPAFTIALVNLLARYRISAQPAFPFTVTPLKLFTIDRIIDAAFIAHLITFAASVRIVTQFALKFAFASSFTRPEFWVDKRLTVPFISTLVKLFALDRIGVMVFEGATSHRVAIVSIIRVPLTETRITSLVDQLAVRRVIPSPAFTRRLAGPLRISRRHIESNTQACQGIPELIGGHR